MDAQELRNLQEAYLEVYYEQELDEAEGSYGQTPKADAAYTKLATTKGKSSKTKALALKHAIRIGKDRYNSDKPYSHRSNMTQSDRDYHRGQSENLGKDRESFDEFDEFDTGASGPGGMPKGKKLERQRKRGISAESYDIYDIILSHLLDEGYATSVEAAEVMMVHMSEDWRESIVEARKELPVGKMDAKAKELKSKYLKSKPGTPEARKLISRASQITGTRDKSVLENKLLEGKNQKKQEKKDAKTREEWYSKKAIEAGTDRFSQLQRKAIENAKTRLF